MVSNNGKQENVIELDSVEVALILLSYRNKDFHHVIDIYYLFKEREDSQGEQHRSDHPSEAIWFFLDVFGGQTLNVPTRSQIERAIRHVQIYIAVQKIEQMDLTSPEKNEAISRVWRGFNLDSRKQMMSIVDDVETALRRLPDREDIGGGEVEGDLEFRIGEQKMESLSEV